MAWNILTGLASTYVIILITYFAGNGGLKWVEVQGMPFGWRMMYEVGILFTIITMMSFLWVILVGQDIFPSIIKTSVECVSI